MKQNQIELSVNLIWESGSIKHPGKRSMVAPTVFDMKFLCGPKRWSIRARSFGTYSPLRHGTKFSLYVLQPRVQRVHKILLSDMLEGTVYVPVDQYRLPVDPSTRAIDLEFLIFEVRKCAC